MARGYHSCHWLRCDNIRGFMKKPLGEYLHVLAIIFPLTLLLIDSVIVACAAFVLLPALHKRTGRLFG